MTIQEDYISTELQRIHQEDLYKHGAIDMLAGRNFIGYVRKEDNNQFSVDVYAWGVHHGKIHTEDSIDALWKICYDQYETE